MTISDGTYSATKVQAFLSSQDDWRTWYRVIKDHAKQKDVWKYFNHDADDETRPDLPTKLKVPAENEASKTTY
jgi:hypothetical protein